MSEEPLIAVIDDDESFRTALVESLDSLGYVALGFGSAEEFIEVNQEGSCDCIITDIQMPGMSGFELKRELVERGSKVPVIMISAHTERGLEAKVISSGAVELLRKPFEADALIRCLKRALKD